MVLPLATKHAGISTWMPMFARFRRCASKHRSTPEPDADFLTVNLPVVSNV
jgi:hypothetical protein